MNITATITLDARSARALQKRMDGTTPEQMAAAILVEKTSRWADDDDERLLQEARLLLKDEALRVKFAALTTKPSVEVTPKPARVVTP